MATPKLIPGGEQALSGVSPSLTESKGVFAEFPGATPKYALNNGQRDNEYRETMARMFIQMSEQERQLFVDSLPSVETQALAKVLCSVDTGGSGGTGFIDFLLTDISEPFQEKIQIVETLSDNFIVYCFGQAAPQFQYSGVLLNTYQDDQRVWMTRLYQDILRGTQLARRRKLVKLRYDSVIVTGIMVAMQQSLRGTEENSVQFAFTLIPTQYTIFTEAIGNPTILKPAATEGGALALNSTGASDTSKVKTEGIPPTDSARPRTNEADQFTEYTETPPLGTSGQSLASDLLFGRYRAAKDLYTDRTVLGVSPALTVNNVRGMEDLKSF